MSDEQSKDGDKQARPQMPEAIEHRISMKWASLEALRVLQDRVATHRSLVSVVLITPAGLVQGRLADITDTYEETLATHAVEDVDAASATAHLRTHLIRMHAAKDPHLRVVDSGPLIHLVDATLRNGARRVRFPHLALFASDVVGFSLASKAYV